MIVLDTHSWIWWVSSPGELGRAARSEIKKANRIGIPAVCCFEVATLAAKGRITLDRPPLLWMQDALELPNLALLPLIPAIAVKAADLPPTFPGDPADRLITATAILESAVLVTKDRAIRESGIVRTVW